MKLRTAVSFLPALAFACAAEEDLGYDPAVLEAYRESIPEESRLVAGVPTADSGPKALALPGDAILAREGVEIARAVNAPARLMVRALREIVDLPPTFFDSEKKEFVWGPWDHEEGVGKVFAYIRENAEGDDFAYSYALARTMDGDLATATPVIWGAATPDAEDDSRGVGATLWDLEANHAFEVEHDETAPDAGRGRFAMFYGRVVEGDADTTFNVAAFRDFVPGDDPDRAPLDVEYFYGRFVDETGNSIHLVETAAAADICDAPAGEAAPACFDDDAVRDLDESFSFVTLFINGGLGRAEASVSGGDVADAMTVTECWDAGLDQTFLEVTSGSFNLQEGACAVPTDQPMSSMELPGLATVDAEIMDSLICVAENGVAGCD